MLNPAIGKLIADYDNRYRLVVDVSKKARYIAVENEASDNPSTEKPVTMAINEIAKERNL